MNTKEIEIIFNKYKNKYKNKYNKEGGISAMIENTSAFGSIFKEFNTKLIAQVNIEVEKGASEEEAKFIAKEYVLRFNGLMISPFE